MENENQVDDAAASSSDDGALSDTSETQGSQAASSDDGTTTAHEPTVAELQQKIADKDKEHAAYRDKSATEFQNMQSAKDQAENRLKPYEEQARLQQEQVDKINEAFHDRAAKIGYPAAMKELSAHRSGPRQLCA